MLNSRARIAGTSQLRGNTPIVNDEQHCHYTAATSEMVHMLTLLYELTGISAIIFI
jgi:hypothetical protein